MNEEFNDGEKEAGGSALVSPEPVSPAPAGPSPAVYVTETKKKNTVIYIVFAVVIFLIAFFAGFMTSRFVKSKETRSFEWVLKTIRQYYYEDVSDDALLNSSLDGLVSNLDIYSAYYTPEEYRREQAAHSGSMSGIGISLGEIDAKYATAHPAGQSGVYIRRVVGNSPAFQSGIKAGEFIKSLKSGGTEKTVKTLSDLSAFTDAKADGERFTIVTDRGEYEVWKENYKASYCSMTTASVSYNVTYGDGGMKIEKESGGIEQLGGAAYMKLTQFYGYAADEMAELIKIFNAEHCTSLILDLRGNGGGYVDVMCDMSGIFTGQLKNSYSSAMHAVYKNGARESMSVTKKYSADKQLAEGVKVSVLADCNTASASEALIGVLFDNGVIGYEDIYVSELPDLYFEATGTANKSGRTYGKGIMQTTYVHPVTKEALKLTTAQIYWPKGTTSIHKTGVGKAQGCNTVAADWDVTYGDEQLLAAIEKINAAA